MRIKTILSLSITILGTVGISSAFGLNFNLSDFFAFNNTPATESQCFDNKDNDNDGFKDCKDIDCFGKGFCSPVEVDCNDKKDNDGDGHIDCADKDCSGSNQCAKQSQQQMLHSSPPIKEICTNMFDDISNGLIDCADPSCLTSSLCNANITSELFCEDGIDNNNNGLTDCEEISCRNQQSQNHCQQKIETACNDNIDNDGDGNTDCQDTNCKQDKECRQDKKEVIEVCFDNIDNDGDGDVDCLDTDCNEKISEEGICQFGFETNCDDGFDNDNNGRGDCEDITCQQQGVCNMSCGNMKIEGTETCDDGNTQRGDGCFDCQKEEPTCELIIEHRNSSIIIKKPHTRTQTQKLIIDNLLVANSFNQKEIPIDKIGTYNIYRQVFNGEKFKQCNQTITIKTIKGCTDEDASNYNAFATYNDGSCTYNKFKSIDCNILNPKSLKQNNQTIYSWNTLANTTSTKGIYLVSKDGRIPASLEGETITVRDASSTYSFLQIIGKSGTILSCPIQEE